MFCPDYGGECERVECRDWNEKEAKCERIIERGERTKAAEDIGRLMAFMGAFAEAQRLDTLRSQASLRAMLTFPGLPLRSRIFINELLQAPSAEVAQRLLEEVNLDDV